VSAAVTLLAFSLCCIPWVAMCEWSEGLFTKYYWVITSTKNALSAIQCV